MGNRLELHKELLGILGSKEVYYRAPEQAKMSYPSIIYKKVNIKTRMADGIIYGKHGTYSITVISRLPDPPILDVILHHFKYIKFDREYTGSGLNHYVYTLNY